jgi:hypothetical protein
MQEKSELRKSPQPPLSRPGAAADADRARRPALADPWAGGQELKPGDRVEGVGHSGKPTGEFGIVEQADESGVAVKWDDGIRMSLPQVSLRKIPSLKRHEMRGYTTTPMTSGTAFKCSFCAYGVNTMDFDRTNGNRRTQAAALVNRHLAVSHFSYLQAFSGRRGGI